MSVSNRIMCNRQYLQIAKDTNALFDKDYHSTTKPVAAKETKRVPKPISFYGSNTDPPVDPKTVKKDPPVDPKTVKKENKEENKSKKRNKKEEFIYETSDDYYDAQNMQPPPPPPAPPAAATKPTVQSKTDNENGIKDKVKLPPKPPLLNVKTNKSEKEQKDKRKVRKRIILFVLLILPMLLEGRYGER